jgi:hypothetical protein
MTPTSLSSIFSCLLNKLNREGRRLTEESRTRFRALKSELDKALRGLLEEAATDGSITVRDVKLTAFTFAGALNWTARWQEPGRGLPPEVIAPEIVEVLLTGILPRPRPVSRRAP